MKKHYAFIPLKEKDLSSFRKSLLASLSLRPIFAILTLCILVVIGIIKQELLAKYPACLLVFSLASALVIYLIFLEVQKLVVISQLHKSSLLPYIHVRNSDSSFYMEEVTNGFIVQVEQINLVDISITKDILAEMMVQLKDNTRLLAYLNACFNSKDDLLINKAVIYVEIIKSQLDKGNHAILASYDRLVNFKEELG